MSEAAPASQAADRPVRVLFVNTRSAAGADVMVHFTLIRNFGPRDCEVMIATNRRAVDVERSLALLRQVPGLRIVVLNLGWELTGRRGVRKLAGAAGNALEMAGALARLAALVWRRRIEVIHSTDRPRDALLATLLARLTRRRNVVHLHIKWDGNMGRATTWAANRCDGVLAISQFVRRSLLDGGIPEGKIHVAHNATDPAEFDPARVKTGAFRVALGIPPDAPLIGIVARIMVWKGQLELVEALAQVKQVVPDARLAIVGKEDNWIADGGETYAERVRRRAAELGVADSVLWAGWFDAMPQVFADLDVVCVPSYEEPFGLVVTEAMAMERPVVGFEAGALPEIICSGREGLLVPARDTDKLAEAIIALLRDPARRREMGRAGRHRVLEQFTPRRQADEVAGIYARLCRKPRAASRRPRAAEPK